jgi:hypothetical protein
MTEHVSTLADEGFLSEEAHCVIDAVLAAYPQHMAELRSVNRLLTASQYRLSVHRESAQELTCAALFIRSLAHCQAAIILLERGMKPSARAMIRCALEGLFNLGACASDSALALSFVDADHVDRKRLIRRLGQVQDPSAKARFEEANMASITSALQARIDEVEAKELQTRSMAKAAGLEDLYLTAYATLSGAVHSSVGDLEAHVEVDDRGRITDLLTEPVVDGLEGPLLILFETMVGLARAVSKVFPLDIVAACEERLERFQKLYAAG